VRILLDNDVFLAAIYAGHEAHKTARRWLDAHKAKGWGIAGETFLAATRLLMNPAVMGSQVLTATEALDAIQTELAGKHPGKVILAPKAPDAHLLSKATGHRQIMDIWLVQIARDTGARLATRDIAILKHWPAHSVEVR